MSALLCLATFFILPFSRGGPFEFGLPYLKGIVVLFLLLLSQARCRECGGQVYDRLTFLLILLTALIVVLYAHSEFSSLTTALTVLQLTSVVMFFVFSPNLNERFITNALVAFVLAAVGISLLGLLQYATIRLHIAHPALLMLLPKDLRTYFFSTPALFQEPLRAPSLFFHSNGFGQYLAGVYGVLAALFLYASERRVRLILGTSAGLVAIAVLTTLSRGALAVIVVETVLLAILAWREIFRLWNKLLALSAVAVAIVLLLFRDALYHFVTRVQESGLSNREVNWSHAASLVREYWLVGAGPAASSPLILNSFPYSGQYLEHLRNDLNSAHQLDFFFSHPHNFYLNALLEGGIFFLVLHLLIISLGISVAYRLFRSAQFVRQRALALGIFAVFCGQLVGGAFESMGFLSNVESGYLCAFYLALLAYYAGIEEMATGDTSLQGAPLSARQPAGP